MRNNQLYAIEHNFEYFVSLDGWRKITRWTPFLLNAKTWTEASSAEKMKFRLEREYPEKQFKVLEV